MVDINMMKFTKELKKDIEKKKKVGIVKRFTDELVLDDVLEIH